MTEANRWGQDHRQAGPDRAEAGGRTGRGAQNEGSSVMSDTYKVSKGLEVLIDNQTWQKGWIG